jgi:hypothetical protein
MALNAPTSSSGGITVTHMSNDCKLPSAVHIAPSPFPFSMPPPTDNTTNGDDDAGARQQPPPPPPPSSSSLKFQVPLWIPRVISTFIATHTDIEVVGRKAEPSPSSSSLPLSSTKMMINRRIAFFLLQDTTFHDDTGTAAHPVCAGLYIARVKEYLGNRHDPEMCGHGDGGGGKCKKEHAIYYVRLLKGILRDNSGMEVDMVDKRLDIAADLHESHRVKGGWREVMEEGREEELEDAWLLLGVKLEEEEEEEMTKEERSVKRKMK